MDRGVQEIVREVLSGFGYACERLNRTSVVLSMPAEARPSIASARVVVADLSGLGPVDYLSIGYAQGLGKPIILLARTDEEIALDTALASHVQYETVVELQSRLSDAIETLVGRAVPGADCPSTVNTPAACPVDDYADRARVLSARGKRHDALAWYEKALSHSPTDTSLLLDYAYTLNGLGQFEKSLDTLKKVRDVEPHSAKCYTLMAYALNGLSRYQDAIQAAEEAIRLEPRSSAAHRHLLAAKARAAGTPVETNEQAQRQRSAAQHAVEALALSRAGQLEAAAAEYEKAVVIDPQNVTARVQFGYVLNRLARPADALTAYDLAVQTEPDNLEALVQKGYTLNLLGRRREAVGCYHQALRIDDRSTLAMVQLAYTYIGLAEYVLARDVAATALRLEPDNVQAMRLLKRAERELMRSGKQDAAG
ncbi:MAG: tetratricopeptide repeat protein [Armatimonadia bacterium]